MANKGSHLEVTLLRLWVNINKVSMPFIDNLKVQGKKLLMFSDSKRFNIQYIVHITFIDGTVSS